jgi:hypothetical protein
MAHHGENSKHSRKDQVRGGLEEGFSSFALFLDTTFPPSNVHLAFELAALMFCWGQVESLGKVNESIWLRDFGFLIC